MEIIHLILHYAYIIFAVVVAFGTVILFHEFGHFIVAKMNNVEAPEFALGMGPEIWGIERGGTRYKLCLFPIGGYVRMVGEDDDEELETSCPPEKNFRNKAPWQKISIIFAGPFMNFILAILLFAIAFTFWGVPSGEITIPVESFSNQVTISFVDSRKPGKAAGFQRYDTILKVNGMAIDDGEGYLENVSKFQKVIRENAGNEITVTVKRGNEIVDIPVTPQKSKLIVEQTGIDLEAELPLTVENLPDDSPAKKAGIKDNDKVVSVSRKGDEIVFDIERGEEELSVPVKPVYEKTFVGAIGIHLERPIPRTVQEVKEGSPAAIAGIKKGDIILDFDRNTLIKDKYALPSDNIQLLMYRGKDKDPEQIAVAGTAGQPLGAELEPLLVRLNPFAAVVEGTKECIVIIDTTFEYLFYMIKGRVSTDEVAGPVGIMQYASDFAQQNFFEFIKFFGVISISLCIVNLFPIPALDGSRIIFHLWEMIIRRPLDPKKEAIVHYVGFCFLIGLILLITFRDLKVILMKYI